MSQSFDGAQIDGGWFTAVATFAHDTAWLQGLLLAYANVVGLLLFVLLMLAGWWLSRHADNRQLARALAVPVAVVLGYLANDVVKSVVQENRPCQSMPGVRFLETCVAPGVWSFPSNHAAISGAVIVAVWLVNRRLGAIAVVCGLLMAFSRVYIGAHYPHDVIVGLLLGAVGAAVFGFVVDRWGPGLVGRLRATPLGGLIGLPVPADGPDNTAADAATRRIEPVAAPTERIDRTGGPTERIDPATRPARRIDARGGTDPGRR